MRTLKMRSAMAWHWKLTTTNQSNYRSWSSYNYMRSCQRTECRPFYSLLAFEANAERWKNLIGGCLMNWPQIKKLVILKHCLLLFYAAAMNHFSIESWPVTKSGFLYDNWWWPAQWWDRGEAAKHFPRPNLHQVWSLFGGLLPVWSTTAFWIPEKPLHLGSMLKKSLRGTENCNTCSRHWSTERCQFFSMATPGHTSHNQRFKGLTSWATKFCLICHIHLTSHQLNITSLSISATFCTQNASTTNKRQKMLSKSSSNPKAQLYTTGKNKLISHW